MVRDTLKMEEVVEHIDLYACALFGINYPDLRRQCRKQSYVEARQTLWKLLKEHGYRVGQLAEMYKRNHGAICNGIRRISFKIDVNRQSELIYKLLKDKLDDVIDRC